MCVVIWITPLCYLLLLPASPCPPAVYKEMSEAVRRHPDAAVLINFASLRSAYEATMEAMTFDKVPYTYQLCVCGCALIVLIRAACIVTPRLLMRI